MVNHAKWDYRIQVMPTNKPEAFDLNRLGTEGWELTSVVGVGELGAVEELWCFLKRSVASPSRSRDR